MRVNNAAGNFTDDLLRASGQGGIPAKNQNNTRQLRRIKERAQAKQERIKPSKPQPKGFQ